MSSQPLTDHEAAAPVSKATQANLCSAYVQRKLAEVSDEAYELGFQDGREEGITEGVEEGRLMGRLDDLIVGRKQGSEAVEEDKQLEPVVKSPPLSPKTLPNPEAKENMISANDPFQSLLVLVRGK